MDFNKMNNTNGTISGLSKQMDLISEFIGYYCITCAVGFLINIFIINLLRSKTLKISFYKHVIIKTVIDSLICIVGMGYFYTSCIGNVCQIYSRYEIIVYEWVIKLSTRYMFMQSSLHEIYLITNRYLTLKNNNNWLIKLKLKYYIPVLVIIPLAFCSPIYLSVMIKPSDEHSELYYWSVLDNNLIRASLLLLVFFENIVPLIILVIMSVLCQMEYKKRIIIKSKIIIQAITDMKKLGHSYTRITIIITTLFIITRVTDFFSSVSARAVYLVDFEIDTNIISIINFTRQLVLLVYFGLHSFNALLYVQIDKNLRDLAKGQFSKIKVFFFHLIKPY